MDPAQTDDRISRMESELQQLMEAMAQGQQDLTQIRWELANIQTGATAPPPAPAATKTLAPSEGVTERYDGDPTTCNAYLCTIKSSLWTGTSLGDLHLPLLPLFCRRAQESLWDRSSGS